MREKVRVSMGTLRVLGLEILATEADPTTAYLQTYHSGKCLSNCRFCAQARDSSANAEHIARGLYPPRDTQEIVSRLMKAYEHGLLRGACIQTMNYQSMFDDLVYLVKEIREGSSIPISVSIFPFPKNSFEELKALGVDRLVIPLDAVTEAIFDGIKGMQAFCPYTWGGHIKALDEALEVFNRGNVGTHLILGLGETERDAVHLIQSLSDKGIYSALFAYTPIPFSQLRGDVPSIGHYRRIQLASYLIESGLSRFDRMRFSEDRIVDFGVEDSVLEETISSGRPFLTRGCPDCNRPYSTESPGGVIYNFPRPLTRDEIKLVKEQLKK
ncbi:MAG: radical SAM protein [Candidatus Altiarchaeota archaeon]|nr:radical SAM protein [Candidatus Altiarchaeota archaeon]